jgi:hypothetical protein
MGVLPSRNLGVTAVCRDVSAVPKSRHSGGHIAGKSLVGGGGEEFESLLSHQFSVCMPTRTLASGLEASELRNRIDGSLSV